jgi:hypothetical protein
MTVERSENKVQTIINGPSFGYTDNFPKREMWQEISRANALKIQINSGC